MHKNLVVLLALIQAGLILFGTLLVKLCVKVGFPGNERLERAPYIVHYVLDLWPLAFLGVLLWTLFCVLLAPRLCNRFARTFLPYILGIGYAILLFAIMMIAAFGALLGPPSGLSAR